VLPRLSIAAGGAMPPEATASDIPASADGKKDAINAEKKSI
jgi:hypothetical protein